MGVDFTFYTDVYKGTDVNAASFPALVARASDVIGAVTRWADDSVLSKLPALYQTLYKKAICAQVDFFALNGTESINDTNGGGGFTVGKVTVHGRQTSGGGSMSASISPLAIGFLEQTGLMNPQVPTLERWW